MSANRGSTLRRVITAVNSAGRSYVAHDGPPDPALEFATGTGLYEIWTDIAGELDRGSSSGFDFGPVKLTPPAGGVKLRWTVFAPEASGTGETNLEAARQFYDDAFASIGAHGDRPDTSRHPGMHLTKTIDFIIVVEGKLRLVLDEGDRLLGPGDVVVQRGTNHAWVNEGSVPAITVAVLIDKAFAL